MPLSKLWAGSLVLLAAVSLPLQAASPVKVGSKIDTEGALLGNIILQVLESHGVPTVNKVQLGTTPVVRGAITSGELDIYPEYTGNGAFFFKDENDAAWKNAGQGYEKVKKLDAEQNKLIWLTPAPANNTWTIAVRQDVAEKNKLTSLADLSRYLKEGGTFKLAASAEFIERADALPAFEKAYGFKLGQDQLLSLAGGDTAVTIKAAAQQTSGVNAAMAYGTDGPVAALGLQTLSDPQGVQPIYAPAPVVRESVLKEYPQMAQWLQPVFASLDEKTLQQLNEVAEESNQLKNAFIANMTHEIRTPLNAIVGFTNVLAETDNLSREERMIFLKEINDNKNFLVQMINDLLDFSKIEANTMEYKDGDVDVNALIQEICAAENAHPRPSGIQIEFVEKLPQCRLMIDRVRFAQVINNLVKNALKFTEQGSVRIGYRRLSNDSFYFYVADTGCGIDEESRRAIFERFVKMNYNIRGTGLGLSITKSIVEHYGGGIGVESKKGEGSTFYFTLPASAEYREYGKF